MQYCRVLGTEPYVCVNMGTGRRFTIAVVNRHRDEPIEAALRFADLAAPPSGRAYVVDGPEPGAVNSFERPDAVGVAERAVAAVGGELRVTFPAHSVTVLVLES